MIAVVEKVAEQYYADSADASYPAILRWEEVPCAAHHRCGCRFLCTITTHPSTNPNILDDAKKDLISHSLCHDPR
jgi:hypothetical protein